MTFKTLISHAVGNSGLRLGTLQTPTENTRGPGLTYDRTDYHSTHGWTSSKGGSYSKKGSAINALSLLAFLFFLNILQNCLRDNLAGSQNPIVVVMTNESTTNSTRFAKRLKRDNSDINSNNNKTRNDKVSEQQTHETMTTFTNNMVYDKYYMTTLTSNQQLIEMINNNVNKHWTNVRRKTNIRNERSIKEAQKEIERKIDEIYNKNTNKFHTLTRDDNNRDEKIASRKYNNYYLYDYFDAFGDYANVDYDSNDNGNIELKENQEALLQTLMWKTMETFKPGLRESVEDTICCNLIACESSRLSKKLGGYIKYFITNYVSTGLHWICRTEEQNIRRAIKIGREGRSCVNEIKECKPKNFFTDIILFIDYMV